MSDRIFDNPIFVKDGNVRIQEISCLEDALEFLYDWPKNRRGPIYQTALRACQRAFDSDFPRSAARDAFASFAKPVRIREEVTTLMPWMLAPNPSRSGGVIA
ncbi:DUF982 domain-containing protein [Mesorhizobium sp. DCY119]|uniref:DUF982 domain-containing protein n=1 Tax=Mesorhizobium sp. DCY119 TaxID=2108445 RepID=UPI000E723FAF|nr:DUF982 domain-containing protein [Mesorhizobium sp. DCY119]RJG40908.1 DUF982 domain-containing protein [Mesorhizobium sp. DCY119]